MRTKNYSLLFATFILSATALYAQDKHALSVQQISTSKWNTQDGIPYKQVPGVNLGAISFEVLSGTEVAYLSSASNEMMVADENTGSVIKKFPVLFAPRDFAYDNGFYYVLNADQVAVYDNNGSLTKNIAFPNNKYTGVEHIARYNNSTYLLLPSGNSLIIESNGMPAAIKEYEGWITSSGVFVKTKITGENTYAVTVITADGKHFDRTFTTERPTAGIYVTGASADRVYVDEQTYITGNPISVERNIVSLSLSANGIGAAVTVTKVPDCYYVLSNNDFHLSANGTLLNMVTAPQGVYVFALTEAKASDAKAYPDYIAAVKYHFNDHMLKVDPK